MTVTAVEWRKTVSFQYELDKVKGKKAFVSARNPETEESFAEKKEIVNDGSGAVSFPSNYEGVCDIHVHGSQGGDDGGQIKVA